MDYFSNRIVDYFLNAIYSWNILESYGECPYDYGNDIKQRNSHPFVFSFYCFHLFAIYFSCPFQVMYLSTNIKSVNSLYIGTFGLGLPSLPIYAESSHLRANIRYIRKVITMCPRLNVSSIKQMLI